MSGEGITMRHGRRIEHERLCVPEVRARRMAERRPPAQWVVDAWRQKQRILRHAKTLALGRQSALCPIARDEGQPSAT